MCVYSVVRRVSAAAESIASAVGRTADPERRRYDTTTTLRPSDDVAVAARLLANANSHVLS